MNVMLWIEILIVISCGVLIGAMKILETKQDDLIVTPTSDGMPVIIITQKIHNVIVSCDQYFHCNATPDISNLYYNKTYQNTTFFGYNETIVDNIISLVRDSNQSMLNIRKVAIYPDGCDGVTARDFIVVDMCHKFPIGLRGVLVNDEQQSLAYIFFHELGHTRNHSSSQCYADEYSYNMTTRLGIPLYRNVTVCKNYIIGTELDDGTE